MIYIIELLTDIKDVQKPKGEKNLRSKPTKEGKNGSFSPLAIQFPHPFEEEEFEL